MRELDKARAYAESLIKFAPDPVFGLAVPARVADRDDHGHPRPGLVSR